MDVFAHVLWTNAVYYKKYAQQRRDRYIAAFFGVMPDIISFTPTTIYIFLFNHNLRNRDFLTATHGVFRYAAYSYNFTHSLVIFALVFLIVTALRNGKVYWPMLGWAFHILLDIPTHPEYYRTPFLFPLSNFHNPYAIAWSNPWFMLINYSALAGAYMAIYYYQQRKRRAVRDRA